MANGDFWMEKEFIHHDGHVFICDAVIVDWRLEQVGVLIQPKC